MRQNIPPFHQTFIHHILKFLDGNSPQPQTSYNKTYDNQIRCCDTDPHRQIIPNWTICWKTPPLKEDRILPISISPVQPFDLSYRKLNRTSGRDRDVLRNGECNATERPFRERDADFFLISSRNIVNLISSPGLARKILLRKS